jgi:hypothetical protein
MLFAETVNSEYSVIGLAITCLTVVGVMVKVFVGHIRWRDKNDLYREKHYQARIKELEHDLRQKEKDTRGQIAVALATYQRTLEKGKAS